MRYRLIQFLDWIYHATPLNHYGLRWTWVCQKWEEMNSDGADAEE